MRIAPIALVGLLLGACSGLLGIEELTVVDDAAPIVDPDAAPQADASGPSEVARALLDQWSGCMSPENFRAANMAQAWGTLAANGQACSGCHKDGDFGFIATLDELRFFDTISTTRFQLLQYFTVDFSPGVMDARIIINTSSFIAVASGQPPHAGHPVFEPLQNAGMAALSTFFDLTVERLNTQLCDPPRLQD